MSSRIAAVKYGIFIHKLACVSISWFLLDEGTSARRLTYKDPSIRLAHQIRFHRLQCWKLSIERSQPRVEILGNLGIVEGLRASRGESCTHRLIYVQDVRELRPGIGIGSRTGRIAEEGERAVFFC